MKEKRIALYIVEDKKSAQYRYRCKNIEEVLGKNNKWEVRIVLSSEITDDLHGIDLVVVERQTLKNKFLTSFIKTCHSNGIKVLFDLDDLIFDYRDLSTLMKTTNSKNVFYWFAYFFGIRRIAKRVDGFIVTNDFLGKKVSRSFNKPYKVIRNSLNKEQVDKARKIEKKNRDTFSIGYFSGSPTHKKDFEMIQSQLLEFLNVHEDAEIMIVGYMDFDDRIKEYLNNGRVKLIKPVEYIKLLDLMSEVDVNIAPLVLNDFTNCKSELKFFEAGIVKTPTIASPSFAFKNAIKDGENGFLAETDEWYGKIELLYNNPTKRKKIAESACKYSLNNYYGDVIKKEIEEAYDYFES